jgi:hypothetical protein
MKHFILAVLSSWGVAHVALGQSTSIPSAEKATVTTAGQSAAPTDQFHQMLARAVGKWTGHVTMTFSPTAPPITSTSSLTNSMAMGGLFQVSEVIYNINGQKLHGIRVTGYDTNKKVFTRAMIQDGGNGVAMEGPWDEATRATTMRYKQRNSSGQENEMKEVYTFVDENTEILEIYRQEPTTKKEMRILRVKWTRDR